MDLYTHLMTGSNYSILDIATKDIVLEIAVFCYRPKDIPSYTIKRYLPFGCRLHNLFRTFMTPVSRVTSG
jgi:hypothetical protein